MSPASKGNFYVCRTQLEVASVHIHGGKFLDAHPTVTCCNPSHNTTPHYKDTQLPLLDISGFCKIITTFGFELLLELLLRYSH